VGHHDQVALTHHGENRHIGDGVGGEVLQLDPVVMEERPHEAICGGAETVAMEFHEANDVALQRVLLPVFRGIHSGRVEEVMWWRSPLLTKSCSQLKGPNMARGGVNSLFKKIHKLTRARG